MSELFTDKFLPQTFPEFVGNTEAVSFVRRWADDWNAGKKGKALLLYGSTGTGKTCLALLTAKLSGWSVFEMNASDLRSKDVIEKLAGAASQGSSLSGQKRLVLLDEIDGLQSVDRGGAGAILSIIRESQNPVILTANDIYENQKLGPVRQAAELVQFKKINYLSIAKRLGEICEKESIPFDHEALKELAKNSAGDLRSALLDLQALADGVSMESVKGLGSRNRQDNIFSVLQRIFRAKTFAECQSARFESEVPQDLLERWVEENIPVEFTKQEDLAAGFDCLSKASIFNGRIFRRQNYVLMKYAADLSTAGVALSRSNDYHGWAKYQFPRLLRTLSSGRAEKALKAGMCKKIGGKMHSSSKEVMVHDLAFIKMLFENKEFAPRLAAAFDLDENEIAFMLETKPETKKVKTILEQAQEIRAKSLLEKRTALAGVDGKFLQKTQVPEPAEKAEEKQAAPEEETGKQTKLF
ncbi:MAG: replication factor C large subunit [Candidatus Diapherotrites archaeon]|nr:replication factor C large subunit [Candidatus Diapherotrites archaeon]